MLNIKHITYLLGLIFGPVSSQVKKKNGHHLQDSIFPNRYKPKWKNHSFHVNFQGTSYNWDILLFYG